MFQNTMKLARFTLRRERVTSALWILGIIIGNFFVLMVIGLGMADTSEARQSLMEMFSNPALLAFTGPVHPLLGSGYSEVGYLYTLFMMVYVSICAAIMNILLIIRHTRTDEEAGRYEVLRSLPSGRLASLNAAMLCAVVVNILTGLLIAVTMWAGMNICGEPGNSFVSALLWGVNTAVVGLFFAAVAALFSQLSHSSSGASAYSYCALGVFYMLSAGANTSLTADREVLAWLSPFGIISRSWPYLPETFGGQAVDSNLWWPPLIALGGAVVLALAAYRLCGIRDIEQGLLPARQGKRDGGWLMKSAGGLNYRLLRRGVLAWIIIMFLLGASYGSVFEDMDNFIASNETYRQLTLGVAPDIMAVIESLGVDADTEEVASLMRLALSEQGFNLAQMFSGMIFAISAMFAVIPVLMYILRARKEELGSRSELLIAAPVTRVKYLLSFISITFITAVFLQVLTGLGMYLVGQGMESVAPYLTLEFMMLSSLAYLPAVWVMAAVAVLFVSLWPRRAGWAWGYFGFTFFTVMFGRMDPSTEFLTKLTPMGWVPSLPIDEWSWTSFTVLTLIAAAMTAVSLVLYSKRDLNMIKQ